MALDAPKKTSSTIKQILIVDDHETVRQGVSAIVNGEVGITICGEAASHEDALNTVKISQPDLMVSDINLRGTKDGFELLDDMKSLHPDIPVLMFSFHEEAKYAKKALLAGAHGYVCKEKTATELLGAIRHILNGKKCISPELEKELAEDYLNGGTTKSEPGIDTLTNRQLEIFEHLGRARKGQDLANRLNLSVKTIESHCENIKRKLNLKSAAELMQHATRYADGMDQQ